MSLNCIASRFPQMEHRDKNMATSGANVRTEWNNTQKMPPISAYQLSQALQSGPAFPSLKWASDHLFANSFEKPTELILNIDSWVWFHSWGWFSGWKKRFHTNSSLTSVKMPGCLEYGGGRIGKTPARCVFCDTFSMPKILILSSPSPSEVIQDILS